MFGSAAVPVQSGLFKHEGGPLEQLVGTVKGRLGPSVTCDPGPLFQGNETTPAVLTINPLA